MADTDLVTTQSKELIARRHRRSLAAWFQLYMALDGSANADATVKAKLQDLQRFLDYFQVATRTDDLDKWTRSVSQGFVKKLRREKSEKTGRPLAATSVNRILATLRTAARWIHSQRPFLAGYPMDRIEDIKGERFARELAGHVSPNSIRRYIMPSPKEQENAIEDIFG